MTVRGAMSGNTMHRLSELSPVVTSESPNPRPTQAAAGLLMQRLDTSPRNTMARDGHLI